MLVLINKYLRSSRKHKRDEGRAGAGAAGGSKEMPEGSNNGEHTQTQNMCIPGCVPLRAAKRSSLSTTTTTTTARASRHSFVRAAASGLLAGASFTNHESLMSRADAYAEFAAAFPQYGEAARDADAVRAAEYGHLDRHVCLDYTGINLFSHAQMNSALPSTSAAASNSKWQPPFFDIAYKSASLRTQAQQRDGGDGGVGAAVTRRIMASLKVPEDEYTMVCTANRTAAFRLLAESYSFHSSSGSGGGNRLLSVYDHESEAATALSTTARRRGARVSSATFTWPNLRVHAADLRRKLAKGKGKGKGGLFVFPPASRVTGARYPFLWASAARERGWHVALDACALGARDLDTLGVALLRPDFIVCSFFKVVGANPAGFAALLVRKTSLPALQRSVVARSIGVVSIVPARRWSIHDSNGNSNGYSTELEQHLSGDDVVDTSTFFSGPLTVTNGGRSHNAEDDVSSAEIREVEPPPEAAAIDHDENKAETEAEDHVVAECRGLDHADALGLVGTSTRLRCVTNWLVVALQKLRHPHHPAAHAADDEGHALVRVYGPRVRFDRGPALAFNVFDWKRDRVAPPLVQRLADRHGLALTCAFLRNIAFADDRDAAAAVLERRGTGDDDGVGIFVVSASLGFLTNFDDAYRLWSFVAKFLDADFVEKERWRYTALNQKTVEV